MSSLTRIRMTRANWLVIGVVAVAAVAFMSLVFVPQMRAISRSIDELDSKLAFVLEAQKSARTTELIERQRAEMQAYINRYDDQLLEQDDLPDLFRQVSQFAKSHDAVTTRFEPHPPVPLRSMRMTPLSLGVSGPLASIHGLLHELESLPVRIWVDDMKLKAAREPGKAAECDLHLVVFIDNPEKTD
ncbi:MAG: type 4a pilus biogenesis protein PilO [Pirellulales bacterium]